MVSDTEDPYAQAAVGKLKLKKDDGIKKKKRKHKKLLEKAMKTIESTSDEPQVREIVTPKTKAELAFLRQQEKMVRLMFESL